MAQDDAAAQVQRRAERADAYYSQEFRPSSNLDEQKRIANAIEFIAVRLCRIDDKLGEIVELLKKQGPTGA